MSAKHRGLTLPPSSFQKNRMSFGRIKLCKADSEFSLFVRERDLWTCNRCHKRYPPGSIGLQCSHYWGRGKESTRFDPENCDALCTGCHNLWGHGDEREQYKAFKIKQLGQNGYNILEMRAHTLGRKDRKLALVVAKALRQELAKSRQF